MEITFKIEEGRDCGLNLLPRFLTRGVPTSSITSFFCDADGLQGEVNHLPLSDGTLLISPAVSQSFSLLRDGSFSNSTSESFSTLFLLKLKKLNFYADQEEKDLLWH